MTEYPPGGQIEVTNRIRDISSEFRNLEQISQFEAVHSWIFQQLTILPYDPINLEILRDEASRRWKLTADEVLEKGTVYEGKYCNDVVVVFNSIMKALGHDAKIAKVFKKNEKGEILIHSLSVIKVNGDETYTVNPGSKRFWVENGGFEQGLVKGWILWELNDDQWAMGLTDSSQEASTILKDAQEYYA